MDEEEIWKPILGIFDDFDGVFEVSNKGRVRYAPRLVQPRNTSGQSPYLQVTLKHRGRERTVLVHRLVANAFLAPPENPEATTVNHKNLTKSDNRPENLEWMTRGDNARHGVDNGHGPIGTRAWNNKADPDKVRALFEQGFSPPAIARTFGVTREAIYQMRNRYKKRGWWPSDL